MNQGSFADVLESYKAGTKDFTENGKCSGCGQCCSNILPLSKSEIETIKEYIRTHGIKQQKHLMPFANAVDFDLCCPFMDISKAEKCTIYEVRPLICKVFMCNRKDFDKTLLDNERKAVFMTETFFG